MAFRTRNQLGKKLWVKLFKAVTNGQFNYRLSVFERHIGYQSPLDGMQKIIWRDCRCVPTQRAVFNLVFGRAHDFAITRYVNRSLAHFHSFPLLKVAL
ncbi:hypothetical protein MCEMIEM13_01489 [Comamonadaceae bacterium]